MHHVSRFRSEYCFFGQLSVVSANDAPITGFGVLRVVCPPLTSSLLPGQGIHMTLKTPIWAVMAGLLVILSFGALWLPGSLTTAAPLDQSRAATAPQAQPAGSGDWRSTGPYGGVARTLALSPNFANDGLALAGGWKTGRLGRTGGYGIVRTTDGGVTWEPVFAASPWSQLAVMDLAISPGFDADATAYAATEAGLLRSGNRGLTWERLHGGLPEPGNDPAADDIVRVLLIAQLRPRRDAAGDSGERRALPLSRSRQHLEPPARRTARGRKPSRATSRPMGRSSPSRWTVFSIVRPIVVRRGTLSSNLRWDPSPTCSRPPIDALLLATGDSVARLDAHRMPVMPSTPCRRTSPAPSTAWRWPAITSMPPPIKDSSSP